MTKQDWMLLAYRAGICSFLLPTYFRVRRLSGAPLDAGFLLEALAGIFLCATAVFSVLK